MGDGGVACVPLQYNIMEKICGGKNGNVFNSKLLKLVDSERELKKNMKANREEIVKKGEEEKSELELERGAKIDREVENGEICVENVQEEVEEGELGSLRWPGGEVENGEFLPEKWRRSEIDNGDIDGDKWREGDVEKGEFISGRWQKGDVAKGEIVSEQDWRVENGKGDLRSWRGTKDERAKGEFVQGKWWKGEVHKDDHDYSKTCRLEADMENGQKFERQRTPQSAKYSTDDVYRRNEFNRSGSQNNKSFSRWEISQERNSRISSKIADDFYYKNDYSNGQSRGRGYPSGNRLKRHVTDSDNSDRRQHYRDYSDYAGSKSQRLTDDSGRLGCSEHYSRHSIEKSYRNPSARMFSSDKYSSRHYESSLTSRVAQSSPGHSEWSPRDRARYGNRDRSPVRCRRSPYGHEKSPYGRERSPYDGSHHYDYRHRSPIHAGQSPNDRARHNNHGTLNHLEKSSPNRGRPRYRDTGGKSRASVKHNSQSGCKGQKENLNQRDSSGRDSHCTVKESQDRSSVPNTNSFLENSASCQSHKEEHSQIPVNCNESPHVDEAPPQELPSMEEDMDICDTPPHVPMVVDSITGKWCYLDYCGVEHGPSRLCDLKELVEEGVLKSDHLIKHLDSDRWVTVENAASPLLTVNFPHIVPETITQLVSPPEAPGNILADSGDGVQSAMQTGKEIQVNLPQPILCHDESATLSDHSEDLHIDERIGALLEGITVAPGKELEIVGEVLQTTFENAQWERWGNSEGFPWNHDLAKEQYNQKALEPPINYDKTLTEASESRLSASSERDTSLSCVDTGDWFSGHWLCKGGDWKRNDEAVQDKLSRKKLLLNDGFPLCQMPKSGCEDPRWLQKDELYFPSQVRRLDLPSWAFSLPDERNDNTGMGRSSQNKVAVVRGAKGTALPVVRINACVVKDHGSFVSETHVKGRGKEKYSSRPARMYSSSDVMRSSAEGDSCSKTVKDQDSQSSWKVISPIKIPRDCLCTVDDLQLNLGGWYYLDGAGHEQGPSSFSDLQILVDKGSIQKYTSVFRKFDKVWVPVTSAVEMSEATVKTPQKISPSSAGSLPESKGTACSESNPNSNSFHNMHPQFIGYTRGKLHELVMKSYKSREFAAAINEVLDPWMNAKQPKKETEKHSYWKSEGDARAGKRPRLLVDEEESDYELDEETHQVQNDESSFEDLCGDTIFCEEVRAFSETEMGSWGLLNGHLLARVLHFLKSDMKSLVLASLTCKHWRAAARFYSNISRQIDLSSFGLKCTDSMMWNIMNGCNKQKINSLILNGCTNITSGMLEEILGSFPHISSIDIRGCSQFGELAARFQHLNWFKIRSSCGTRDDSHAKAKTLKQITEKSMSVSKVKGPSSDVDDFGALNDYFDSVGKRDAANTAFGRSFYKRSKLFDARRSSSISSRDARIRRWAIKKSEIGYKRTEEFLALSLKNIMKENTFDFFLPKVAQIEDRMKNGYYIGRLSTVKEDISRMCRDAIKVKTRGDARDMNHIITLFIQLATRLENSSKSSHDRDKMMKSWKDDSPVGFCSAASKYKKKISKLVTEKKYTNKNNGTPFMNGVLDYEEFLSDREIRRRLSKLNSKSLDSECEMSDDLDRSSEDGKSYSEITASDTESDMDFRSACRTGEFRSDGYFIGDEAVDSMTEDREWGARMTEASLVPPVTRKYEVIDRYIIVADEEDVQRKMRVSLPEDYTEKLNVQKNGTEESDMELPEVKNYKPRKELGNEVIEQEVYGIDPYTHNLLLDSMPEELDWSLSEKHLFVEDVLLRTLNKQVRRFTGTGGTPMKYPLRPVIEEIEKNAEGDGNIRTLRMCKSILKAIDSRPDDNYIAYRKGLGVVCNKEGGFGEDDFVVEFLGEVYPAWKWFEKQDGIRSLQKNSTDPAPEFYNIHLERPKGDADGYDLVVVDAMHKANYASRICHSCKPNCEAKVTAVDGQYQIGIYSVRKIHYGEEITFDYNSVTESKEEYEASVCLCGSQVCRGSYLNLTGEGAFEKVLDKWHGMLDRHQLMVESCELNFASEEDYVDLGRAGLGSSLLGGLPDWLIAYTARLVRFINFERTKLPEEILKHNLEEKRKYYSEICLEVEKSDAEVQAEGVYNQRLQNLALTIDKVRYVMRCVFGDPKKAPPPLEKLRPEDLVSFLWKGEGSLVEELLQCMSPHMDDHMLSDLRSKIKAHDPSGSEDILKEIQKSLLWLRDEVRNLPCTYKSRHDAAADLIHIYAYTKCFFRVLGYKSVTSPPVYISPLDMGPKYTDKMGTGLQEYCKTYGENYCLGQLIFWHIQTNAEPDCSLARASRGCLSLPDIGSFYAKVQKPSRHRVYGPRTSKFMLTRMEKQPQRPWPKDRIWWFKSFPKVFGSPMLDTVLNNSPLDKNMVHWLKTRPAVFQAMWDR